MSIPSAYVSRPAILIDGQDEPRLSLDVLSAFVEETVAGLFRCEIVFNNYGRADSGDADYLYFQRETVDFGKKLEVGLGPGDPPETIFEGYITGLEAEYPPEGDSRLLVLAEDRLQDLRMTRRSRAFEDITDSDVISEIASEHGLQSGVDLTGPTHQTIAQVNLSDLAFIRERARSVGAEVWVEDDTLYAMRRDARSGEDVVLAYGMNLIAFNVRADLAHQCTELRVTGWDVAAKEGIEESADDSAISSELNGDESGSAILGEAFGDRVASVVHTVPLTSDEAEMQADARFREKARRFVTGTGISDGDPRLRVGRTVSLSGLGSLFDGDYYVVRARHTYDLTSGYRTEFDVERAGLGPA